jgi:hypothetical protein
MGQPRELNWGEAAVGLEQVWRCRCWDCMAHRRHVLRKLALVAVLLGLSCGWAIETSAVHLARPGEVAPAVEVTNPSWF